MIPWPPERSDLPLKARLFRAMTDGYDIPLARALYRWHTMHKVRAWDPDWKAMGEYLKSSEALLESFQSRGFDPKQPVRLGRNKGLMDGAHRMSLCGALGIPPVTSKCYKPGIIWDFDWFVRHGLPLDHQQRLLYDWVRFDSSASVFLLWAPCRPRWNEMLAALKPDFTPVGHMDLTVPNIRALVFDVYGLSPNLTKMMKNVSRKREVLTTHPSEIRVIVAKRTGAQDVEEVKQRVRRCSGDQSGLFLSCHASSSRREALYLADVVLSPTNFRHLWWRPPGVQQGVIDGLIKARGILHENGLDFRDACVVGGSVMDVLGLRDSSGDIDLTVTSAGREVLGRKSRPLAPGVDLVSRNYHRGTENPYDDNALIASAEAHFNVLGMKFATACVVKDSKTLHARSKDLRDVELLKKELPL